jgi:hypothetical protein
MKVLYGHSIIESDNWIADAVKNKGALKDSLGVKKGKKIPKKLLTKAANSKDITMAKRARLAQTLASFHKG